jgi:imidazolonepropionase-like amidohydrolase
MNTQGHVLNPSGADGPPAAYSLRGAQLLEHDGSFGSPADLQVTNGIVTAVGDVPRDRDVLDIDASGTWLMPGMFDCHTHLAMSSLDPAELLGMPLSQKILEGARNARATLDAGVTFVRDAGGADRGFRTAFDAGIARGPRMQISVVLISQTGGHADGFLEGPGIDASAGYLVPDYPGRPPFLVDGVESMTRTVRKVLRAGADWIKLCATGGFNSPHDDPLSPELTAEEMAVAVSEARRRGKHVLAHAVGGAGIDNALEAGVRSIEHGFFLTEEQAHRMAAGGHWLVPTLSITRAMFAAVDAGAVPQYVADKVRRLRAEFGNAVRIAIEAGVPIATGSDFFSREYHGGNLGEISLLHASGMSAERSLLAATAEGAKLCRVDDHLGRIAPGYVFDAIAFTSEPQVHRFGDPGLISAVIKGGVAHRLNNTMAERWSMLPTAS